MKSVTEFPNHKLVQALQIKTQLTGESKTPEEIQAAIGEKFKLEGDKLKFFCNAVEVASQNLEGLSRIMVVTLNEGESVPAKAVKLEEHTYVPDFVNTTRPPVAAVKASKGGPGGGKGGKGGKDKKKGPRESPWGLSPEEKAAKKGKQQPPPAT